MFERGDWDLVMIREGESYRFMDWGSTKALALRVRPEELGMSKAAEAETAVDR
jgi:hypothetical protein